jgi:antitoxin CcdA
MRERQVKKRAVNLFVDTELLDEARRLRINISDTLERRLRSIVRAEQERRWLEANQAAIAAYNLRVSRDGLLSDEAGHL